MQPLPPSSPLPADEARLLERLRLGDSDAFTELHRRHHREVLASISRVLRNPGDVEDVAQEVFLSVHRSLHRFEGRSRLATWIVGIARNQALHRRARSRSLLPLEIAAGLPAPGVPADRVVAAREELARCERTIRDVLSERQRRILALRAQDDLDTRSIARLVGRSASLVKTDLHRSRRLLARRAASLDAMPLIRSAAPEPRTAFRRP